MNCFDMQRFLANSAFSVSLALLIFYWVEAAFLSKSRYHNLGGFWNSFSESLIGTFVGYTVG